MPPAPGGSPGGDPGALTAQQQQMPRRPLLLRQADLGDFGAPAPRVLPRPDRVLRWGRPVLLPLSSVMRVGTRDRVISLTYDDGPDPVETPPLLDVLAERGAKATFFVLTELAEAYPDIVLRALAEGHEVELHGIDHARLTDVPVREAVRRVREGKQRLEAITGRPVRYYRPTYGAISLGTFTGVKALGLETVIWSAWGRDWEDAPAQDVADLVADAVHPGAIVLLHDRTADSMETGADRVLPTFSRADVARRLLDHAALAGYTSVTVGELLRRYPVIRSVTVQRPRLPRRG